MGFFAKVCGVVTVFGALNWAAMGLFKTDAVHLLFDGKQTPATNAAMIVVAMGAMFMLAVVARPKKQS